MQRVGGAADAMGRSLVLTLGLALGLAGCDSDGAPAADDGGPMGSEGDTSTGDASADAGPDATEPTEPTVPAVPKMTLVTGETTGGFVDGVGREARFEGITCMTVAPDGSALYVSDTFNGIVRRVDTQTGEVTTIGGEALSQATSDGVGATVRFTEPRGLGVTADGETLWVADGPTLRTLDLTTGEAITWAGLPGEPGYVDGDGVEARLGFLVHDVDVSEDGGTVYLSDRSNDCVRTWDVASGELTTLAGGGAPGADGVGAQAGFNGNGGIARVGDTLYVADTFAHTLRAVDLDSVAVTTIAGTAGQVGSVDGDAAAARLDSPQGLAFKGGALYAGGFNGQVRRVDLSDGAVTTVPVSRLTGTFSPPVADPSGNGLYYADLLTESIVRIDLDANKVTPLAGPVQPEGYVDGPLDEARFGWIYGVTASADGQRLYVADPANQAVRVVDLVLGEVGSLTHELWDGPVGLALDDAAGQLYVGDANTGQVWRVALEDGAVSPLTDGFEVPWGLALAGGTLYVAEHTGLRVQAVDVATGDKTVVAGTGVEGSADGTATDANFRGPLGLAWDGATETLFIADFSGHTVRALDVAAGTVSTVAGTGAEGSADGLPGELFEPSGLVLRDGRLFVSDTGNHTVRVWDAETGLSTVVGQVGTAAAIGAGPGVPVDEATLTLPEAMAAGATGLYVSVEYGLMHIPWESLEPEAP